MRTTSSSSFLFSGLVLASVFVGAGCNVWIDGDPIGDGFGGKSGYAGSATAGSGLGGQAGAGGGGNGYAGKAGGGLGGQAGKAGGGPGGQAGSAGGGLAGQAGAAGGSGTGLMVPADFSLVGGDVREAFEVFPFGVAIAPDGALFVSTLGNRNNEPSRIYRFNPGTTSNPEVLFEVGNAEDAAVYGLAFDYLGNLHACVSQHLDSPNNNIVASLLHFDPAQLGQSFLGPANVANTQLRTTAVNVGGSFVVSDAVAAGRCGPIAFDGELSVFVPDVSGESQFLFRFNMIGFNNVPGGNLGDPIGPNELTLLTLTAWSSQPEFGPGGAFGVSGVAASENGVQFVRADENITLFNLGISGFDPDPNVESTLFTSSLLTPFGLAPLGQGKFLASSLDDNRLVLLRPDGEGALESITLFDESDSSSFLQPAGIAVRDDAFVIAGSQINLLGAQASETAKVFSRSRPGL